MKMFNSSYLVSSGCILLSSLLVACGGGGSGGGSTQVAGATEGNAVTISGSPNSTVTQGLAYRFDPFAPGDSLTFSIENLPAWGDLRIPGRRGKNFHVTDNLTLGGRKGEMGGTREIPVPPAIAR